MRSSVILLAALGLAACSPRIPDSGGGVGFQDYNSYGAPAAAPAPANTGTFSPDAALAAIDKAEGKAPEVGAPLSVLPPAVTPYAPSGSTTPSPYAQPSYAAAQPSYVPPTGERARGNAPAGIVETTSEMNGGVNPSVSDEQDFQAVTKRESIESDAARIARNRAQYQVDQPTALPQRVGDTGPNIVEFAISTNHPKGTQMYRRSSLRLTSYNGACARYPSPDLAQEAFLAAGGPDRDRKGLDPDGDGYACAWDPTPFRAAVQQ